MAIASNFPAIRPSLDLNFAAGNFDPRITFSRASAATYYDGKTVAKAEENLFTNSDGPLQTVFNGAVYNGDGTISFSAPANISYKIVSKLIEAGTQFTVSVLLSGVGVIGFGALSGAGGVIGSYAQISLTPTPVKYYLTVFNTASGSNCGFGIQGASDGSAATAKIEKYQFEIRDQATAYTPTTTQPITNYIPVLQTAPANVPRIDHDPVTGECKGLLIEEQRTNLFTYSEFGSGLVGPVGLITLSTMFGPTGLVNAARFSHNGATDSFVYKGAAQASVTNTVSVYVKMDDGLAPNIVEGQGSHPSNDFAIVVAGNTAPVSSYQIQHVGNSVYRVSASAVAGVTNLGNNGIVKYQGNSPRKFTTTAWQLEAGAFPASYIKTEASQVTRAADSAQMTGANFSSWYRQDEGTLFAEATAGQFTGAAAMLLSLNKAATPNSDYFVMRKMADNAFSMESVANNAVAVASTVRGGSWSPGSKAKLACGLKTKDYALVAKGALIASSSLSPLLAPDSLRLGATLGGSAYWNGHISRLAYYPGRQPDAQLQALTA